MAKKASKKASKSAAPKKKRGPGAPKITPAVKKARHTELEKVAKKRNISVKAAQRIVRFKRGTAKVAKILAKPARVSSKRKAQAKAAGKAGGRAAKAKSHSPAAKKKAKVTRKHTAKATPKKAKKAKK